MAQSGMESLAANGLEEFVIGDADVEAIGTNPKLVGDATESLQTMVTELNSLIEDLTDQKDNLLASWVGESADAFGASFPTLIEAFEEVPTSIASIQSWAETHMSNLQNIDKNYSL